MRFDPTFSSSDTDGGKWYLNVKDKITGVNLMTLISSTADLYPTDFTRATLLVRILLLIHGMSVSSDTREANERTYKLRYVIPKYLENARDPINGFVLKTRTDDTRKLVPQKLLLKLYLVTYMEHVSSTPATC